MSPEDHRAGILAAEAAHDRAISLELARLQSRGPFGNAFDRHPWLAWYHGGFIAAAERLERERDQTILAIETAYYCDQGFEV